MSRGMRYRLAAASIPRTSTGVYLAFPTTLELKPVYRGYKTLVSAEDTKVGIARSSFAHRERQYMKTFQAQLEFFPLLELPAADLVGFEKRLLQCVGEHYARSGPAREWFRTKQRQHLAELVWSLHVGS